ncbi:MAG: histidine ammonia-lyase, partial [Saprospiraceae bacterium]|nr:histidine ammonia-lyase [Saprospiraceae bacterium]
LLGTWTDVASQKIVRSQEVVSQVIEQGDPTYGINTGFGPLCTTTITIEEVQELQHNLLLSHSAGVGDPVDDEKVRLMLILKLHALSMGHSGISMAVLKRIQWHLDSNFLPFVPMKGSVGASGDLAPLAHLFLPLIGEGSVKVNSVYVSTKELLKNWELKPLTLQPKEALALINGTQFMLAFAVCAVSKMHTMLESADLIAGLTLEALRGSRNPFQRELHALRPHIGAQHVAHRMWSLLGQSEIMTSHADCDKVQDPYSLRCIPAVHGSSRNAWLHLKKATEVETNSVTDNPIVLEDSQIISGGNFHGQPLALPLDYCCLAAAELGNISDRRTYLLLEGRDGLPKLLVKSTGVQSGFMIPQYTSAALVSENKTQCFPASADSIPTSLGQEDHVSMGSISGRKLNLILNNLPYILAVELLCGCQAMDYRRPLKSNPVLDAIHNLVRKDIAHTETDKIFAEDLEHLAEWIRNGVLVQIAEEASAKHSIDLKGPHYESFSLS